MNFRVLFLVGVIIFSIYSDSLSQGSEKLNLDLATKIRETGTGQASDQYLLVQGDIAKIKAFVEVSQGVTNYHYGDIANIMIPRYAIEELSKKSWVKRIESPNNNYVLMNDSMRSLNHVNAVHTGVSPLIQAYKGKDVILGIIDSGVDFTHADLQDSTGKTRILNLWDQNLAASSNTPQPYGYGQAWTGPEIDLGLAAAHNDKAYFGHGTHVTGISAGNALANGSNRGVAPQADIIEVAFNFNDDTHFTYSDAVNYIFTKANLAGKPCVINASLGDYYGSHDGKDLQSQLISNMLNQQPGRVMVAAAGNAGTIKFHLGYNTNADTSWTWLSHNPSFPSLYFQVWADTSNFKNVKFSVGADANITSASFRGKIPFSGIANHLGIFKSDTLFSPSGNRLAVIQSYGSLQGPTYLMEYNIIPDSTSYKWRWMTTGTGKFDIWKFYDGSGQSGFFVSPLPTATAVPDIVFYKLPDDNQTIVSGFQCLENVIAVGNYGNRSEYLDVNGNLYSNSTVVPGEIAQSSSWGPTRDGRIKPDISASGGIMISSGEQSLLNIWAASAQADKVAFGGKHFRDGGTSSSSPVVAGIAALYLEKYPSATAMDVKNAIINCAMQDTFTGSNLPNNIYGYGKAVAYETLVNCGLTSLLDAPESNLQKAYPNPVMRGTDITLESTVPTNMLIIYDLAGRQVKELKLTNHNSDIVINTSELESGIYFIKAYQGQKQTNCYKVCVSDNK